MAPDALDFGFATLIISVLLFMFSITLFINYKTSGNPAHKLYAKRSLMAAVVVLIISFGACRVGISSIQC